MNQDDIIRMAREAGIDAEKDTLCRFEGWVEPLKRFAALVIANNPPQSFMSWQEGFEAGKQTEREACAKIIETYRIPVGNSPAGEMACEWTHDALKEIRDAIRARGQK